MKNKYKMAKNKDFLRKNDENGISEKETLSTKISKENVQNHE